MNGSEPTNEQWEEARALAAEWTLLHLGNTGATATNLEVVLPRMIAHALAAREAQGFARGQKTNPATVWGWAAAVGNGWLLCPMVLRGDQLVVDVNDVRGMIFGEPGREGYAAVRRLRVSQYTKRVRRKTMEGARSALSKLMGESIPALPDSKEPR